MLHVHQVLCSIILASATICAWPSTEGIAIWSNFSVDSAGIDSSGRIKISGVQTSSGIDSLTISAFDRTSVFSPAQLSQLRGFSANGMSLSYEHGYESHGGRTLYVTLMHSFTFGIDRMKIIEVNEQGRVVIGKTEERMKTPKELQYKSRVNVN